MSEEKKISQTESVKRRKRVNNLKRIIIIFFMFMLVLPLVLLYFCNRTLLNNKSQIEQLSSRLSSLEAMLESRESVNVTEEPVQTGEDVRAIEASEEPETQKAVASAAESESPEIETEVVNLEAGMTLKDEYEGKKKVYLTFDDGPSAYTEEILEILDRYDIKATFFVLAKNDDNAAERIRKIYEAGHTVGMHSYSHVYSDLYDSEEQFVADFNNIYDYIKDITGEEPFAYRFPGGSSNQVSRLSMEVFAKLLEEREVTYFDWNVANGDGTTGNLSKETLCDNVLRGVAKNDVSVVLMHDAVSRRSTVDSLSLIIEKLLEEGDVVFLPITKDTEPVRHRDFTE